MQQVINSIMLCLPEKQPEIIILYITEVIRKLRETKNRHILKYFTSQIFAFLNYNHMVVWSLKPPSKETIYYCHLLPFCGNSVQIP